MIIRIAAEDYQDFAMQRDVIGVGMDSNGGPITTTGPWRYELLFSVGHPVLDYILENQQSLILKDFSLRFDDMLQPSRLLSIESKNDWTMAVTFEQAGEALTVA